MSSSSASEPVREFDRVAVVAIQGGGVYGLSMLGQLSAVVEADISPIALAGTSAGAIVAALFWAGYSPKDIREMFVDLAMATGPASKDHLSRETLVDLLGPFGDPPLRYHYHQFQVLTKVIDFHIRRFVRSADNATQPDRRKLWWRLELIKRAEVIGGLAMALCTAAVGHVYWRAYDHSTHTIVLAVLFSWLILAALVCRKVIGQVVSWWNIASDILAHPWPKRGFFPGARLEEFICQKLRESPRLSPFRAELQEDQLTFGRVAALQAAHPDDDRTYFVPLILTATDLDKGELVLIASHDPRFANIPIAKAVRASAGFPVFFSPVEVSSDSFSGCLVDGGFIANYPAWVFSRAFRRTLSVTMDYRDLATRPWMNIGLRILSRTDNGSAATTGGFLQAVYGLVRGKARDQLEKALAAPLPHTVTIDQPEHLTDAPSSFLNVHELTRDKIRTMFLLGREFATEHLRGVRFALPNNNDEIHQPLNDLLKQVNLVLGERSNDKFGLRASIFAPWEDGLIMRYDVNVGDDRDRALILSDSKGLTGTCFSSRRPCLCNLEILRRWAEVASDPNATQLGMVPWEHLTVREDRTWLINVPIFDPQDSWFLDEIPERTLQESDAVWAELPIDRDGAVFGVLNVDGAIPYGELGLSGNPETDLTDVRIECILSVLWSCSTEIGRSLSRAFARRS